MSGPLAGEALYAQLPIPFQNLACSYAGWKRARARYTPYFHDILDQWMETADAPLETLHSIQAERLERIVEIARKHVPHYQTQNLPPASRDGDARQRITQTLASIPPLEKQSYRDAPESFVNASIPPGRLRKGKTSGTTGTALPLWYTPEALAEEFASVWRLRRRLGIALDDPHFTFGGQLVVPLAQKRPPFHRRNYWTGQTLFSLYHMTSANMEAYIDALHAIPGTYVQGYPSSLHLIGRAMLDAGRPLPAGKLRAVLPSSESLLAFHREVIEEAFAAPIHDRYGTSEFVVSMTGCSEGALHVDMEFGIVEVDVEEETEDWERGSLLVTGLGNDATPFLRYRVGDVGTRSKRPCACGRPGDVFLDVDGRVEDYVVTPDGRWIGRLDHIFKEETDIAEAQILQETEAAIEVRIVPKRSFDAAARASLMKQVRSRLGEEIGVEVVMVEEIPREANGKFRAVKSKVGRNVA